MIAFVFFTVVLGYLLKTLKMIPNFFKRDQNHIIWQFFGFWLGLLLRMVFQSIYLVARARGDWSNFMFLLNYNLEYLLVDILPVAFMLYSHRRSFSKEISFLSQATHTDPTSDSVPTTFD